MITHVYLVSTVDRNIFIMPVFTFQLIFLLCHREVPLRHSPLFCRCRRDFNRAKQTKVKLKQKMNAKQLTADKFTTKFVRDQDKNSSSAV